MATQEIQVHPLGIISPSHSKITSLPIKLIAKSVFNSTPGTVEELPAFATLSVTVILESQFWLEKLEETSVAWAKYQMSAEHWTVLVLLRKIQLELAN